LLVHNFVEIIRRVKSGLDAGEPIFFPERVCLFLGQLAVIFDDLPLTLSQQQIQVWIVQLIIYILQPFLAQ
jgi:hypothetical protein